MNSRRKGGSKTSSFGSPSRFNHNSSKFYRSKLYDGLSRGNSNVNFEENPVSASVIDKIFCKSSERMEELPD
ncbi:MAG: site-specific DNA-methyltransferase, partial [Thermoplasmatales archaeon]